MKGISLKILAARKKKVVAVLRILKKMDPKPRVALEWKNPWQLVVAVQLSAQCTDKLVNKVTPGLFKKYKDVQAFAKASPDKLDKDIAKITFHRNKSKNIVAAAKKIVADFRDEVPRTMRELVSLPGMGRKSANIILSSVWGIGEGIAVDTHVWRLSRILGLSDENTPEKIEQDLMHIVPKKDWPIFNYLLVDYGRAYCPGRVHDHKKKDCPLARFYVRERR